MSGKKISEPMQVVALRLTHEERDRLQRLADEHHVTLSWVLRQGARLYAEDACKWLEGPQGEEGSDGQLATS